MRKTTAVTTTAVLCLTLAACGGDGEEESGLTRLTVAMVAPACLPLNPTYVAESQGYFEEQGLDVTIEAANGSAAVLQALAAGQAEIGRALRDRP